MQVQIEVEQEEDGRFIAEAPAIPGAMAYGKTRQGAVLHVLAVVLLIAADKLKRFAD